MKQLGAAKHFVLAFVMALVGYIIAYQVIEGRRNDKGPWQVVFTQVADGAPHVIINQPSLAITNVQLVFTGPEVTTSNSVNVSFVFEQPRPVPFSVPFGQCLLMDLRFLPGTLTFELFGHEIELLPRGLMVDGQEHPWQKDLVINLHPRP